MSKLLHCSKRTTVLLIIQISILISGIALGIIGRIIQNDLMKKSMDIMPILVCILLILILVSEKDNLKLRNTGEKSERSVFIGFGIVFLIMLILHIGVLLLLLS